NTSSCHNPLAGPPALKPIAPAARPASSKGLASWVASQRITSGREHHHLEPESPSSPARKPPLLGGRAAWRWGSVAGCLPEVDGRRCVAVAATVAVAVAVTVTDRRGRGRGGRLDGRGGGGGGRVAVGHGDRPGGVGRDLAVRPAGGGVHGHGGIERERQAERPGSAVRGGPGVMGRREVVDRCVSHPPG